MTLLRDSLRILPEARATAAALLSQLTDFEEDSDSDTVGSDCAVVAHGGRTGPDARNGSWVPLPPEGCDPAVGGELCAARNEQSNSLTSSDRSSSELDADFGAPGSHGVETSEHRTIMSDAADAAAAAEPAVPWAIPIDDAVPGRRQRSHRYIQE